MEQIEVEFKWSTINKHASISIDEKIAGNKSGGFHSVLLEPRLSFGETKAVHLKLTSL